MLMVAGFDWNDGNTQECLRHGMALAEIGSIFEGSPVVAPDLKQSAAEDRFLAIGMTPEDRRAFAAFTFRGAAGARLIRPITARYMHEEEFKAYEKSAETED
jgi:uncharacterized protein